MIAKIIVWDESRPRAIQKLNQTLSESFVFGVHVNFEYLKAIINHPEFLSGKMTTQFISKYFAEGLAPQELSTDEKAFADHCLKALTKSQTKTENTTNPWNSYWRLV